MNQNRRILIVCLILIFVGVLALLAPGRPAQPARAQTSVIMLPAACAVPPGVQEFTNQILNGNSGDLTSDYFAITAVDYYAQGYIVSIAGLSDLEEDLDWDVMEDMDWSGTAIMSSDLTRGDLTGTPYGTLMWDEFGLTEPVIPDYNKAGLLTYWPFYPGFQAGYGSLGVHSCGSGGKAIDLIGGVGTATMPNDVYAAEPGSTLWKCSDGVSAAVKVGDYYYYHFVNEAIFEIGHWYNGHAYLGELKSGNFDGPSCGSASNSGTSYHLHWCFGNSNKAVEDCTINVASEVIECGYGNQSPGTGRIRSNWVAGPTPTPGPTITPGGPTLTPTIALSLPTPAPPTMSTNGASFWDPLVAGVIYLATILFGQLPDHDTLGLPLLIASYAAIPLKVLYGWGFIRLTFAMVCVGIILAFEVARVILSVWRTLWKMLPFGGK